MSSIENGTPYNVPLIPTDLRPEETIHHICDSLEYLHNVSNDVFDRLGERVAEYHTKLSSINDRIALAQAKVEKVRGSNKATKVFSSAKYPNPEEELPYETVYKGSSSLHRLKKSSYKVQSKHKIVDDQLLKEKLQSFAIPMHIDVDKKKNNDNEEGLGKLPANVESISSLLLFNTSENPYKKYVLLDPLGVVTKTRKAEEEEEGLPEAPSTILQGEELHRLTTENYSYMPGLGDVPEIVVPDFLPDLLGVADDLSYSADLGPSIGPSVSTANLPELPSFGQEDTLPSGPLSNDGAVGISPITPTSAPPPPPPPPPPPGPEAPPPPPPPPPPSSEKAPPPPPPPPTSQDPVPADTTPKPKSVPPANDGRASLLESIRQAGGKAKLRNAKNRKVQAKKRIQEEKETKAVVSSGGGDLMSDLTAKLQLRRKGISGTGKPGGGKDEAGNRGSAMDRISAMIPAPAEQEQEHKKTEDEDWN